MLKKRLNIRNKQIIRIIATPPPDIAQIVQECALKLNLT